MFDNITAPEAKRRAGTSMAVSIALHGAAVALAFAFAYVKARMPKTVEAPVAVTFPPPPPPPPPPPAARHKTTPREIKPKQEFTTQTVIQPKEIPKVEEKPPDPDPEAEEDLGVEGGVEGGVVGGVVGGGVGGQIGGVLPGQGTGPVEFNDTMTPPRVLSGPNPEYTPQALEKEVEGTMIVKCIVSVQGQVRNCRIMKSLPFMDRAVISSLERRKYSPALLHGQPIEVDYIFNIKLNLPQ